MKLATIIKYIFCIIGVSITTMAYAQISQQKIETRAVWLTTLSGLDWPSSKANTPSGRELQKNELRRILDQYQRLHINTVLLQTRVRGTMIYPSVYEGWDPCLTGVAGKDPGYDPLQFAIEECHKRGMELHCWMVTIPSGNAKVHNQLGYKSVTKTHPELVRKIKDYWYLDPGNPETRHYLTTLCQEIVQKYDVDGIHFDFIRYPENSGESLDRISWTKYGAQTGKSKADWRRDNITALVREMFNTVKSIKPWVKVTAAPLGKYADTNRFPAGNWNGYNRVYQDAQLWMKEGIVDGVFPMIYHSDDNFYPFVCDWIENSNGRPVTAGLGIYFLHPSEGKWTLDMIQRQMNFCRSKGIGVAHYRSKFLTDNTKGLFNWCEEEYYPYPALPAGMPWLSKKAPSNPQNLVVSKDESKLTLSWDKVNDPDFDTYVTYNVYRSKYTPVNTNDPANLLVARLMDNQIEFPNDSEDYHYAVTAVDRAGNESNRMSETNVQVSNELHCSNGMLHIPSHLVNTTVIICDITERELLSIIPYSQTIDVTHLKEGSYWLKYKNNNNRTRRVGVFFR